MAEVAVIFEQQLDTYTTHEAGVLVRPSEDQSAAQLKAEIERAMTATDRTKIRYGVETDDYSTSHAWLVLRENALADLAGVVAAVGEAFESGGVIGRVVAVVYPFTWSHRRVYWIYQPRIQAYTPFAPAEGNRDQERDHPLEVRMESAIRRKLPTSRDITNWYPIWGMPV